MIGLPLLIGRGLLASVGSRRALMLENVALRHQLQVALRRKPALDFGLLIVSCGYGCGPSGRRAGMSVFGWSDQRPS